MPEPTLALKYDEIAGEVGLFLGWGRGAANGDRAWDTGQAAAVESCVRSGLRQFYSPAGDEAGYEWSFLRPVATFTLDAAVSTLALPDDYGGVEGKMTVTTTGSTSWEDVDFLGVGQVYQKAAELPDTTGRPEMCCEEPVKGTTMTRGQRFQLRFWPTTDQAYTLKFAYTISPDCLSGTYPYAYGGAVHAETVLESCLSIAEQRLDDTMGVHTQKFMERLAASVALDRRHKPQTLGLNLDRSEQRIDPRWRHWQNPITYGGIAY